MQLREPAVEKTAAPDSKSISESKTSTPSSVPEAKIIDFNFVTELSRYLDDYIAHKTGSDAETKKQKFNVILGKLQTTFSEKNTDPNIWLDLVIEIFQVAEKMQLEGSTCSQATERLCFVAHRLRKKIADDHPDAFKTRVEKEKQVFNELKEAHQINEHRRRLAYLGNVDFLLLLSPEQILRLYPNQALAVNVPVIGETANGWLTGLFNAGLSVAAAAFSNSSILGFEYTSTPHPYGFNKVASSMALPLVLQPHFPEIFLRKYANKLKVVPVATPITLPINAPTTAPAAAKTELTTTTAAILPTLQQANTTAVVAVADSKKTVPYPDQKELRHKLFLEVASLKSSDPKALAAKAAEYEEIFQKDPEIVARCLVKLEQESKSITAYQVLQPK